MGNLVALAFTAVLVICDQLIKIRVLENLADVGRVEVVPKFFYLTYVENRGAAFGIMQNQTVLLSVITGIVLLAALYVIVSGRLKSRFLVWSLSLVIAGGVGNLIDRIFRGFVIDYLDFSALFGFPVFNLADCCVVGGTLLLLCGILWLDRKPTETEDGDKDDSGKNLTSGEGEA